MFYSKIKLENRSDDLCKTLFLSRRSLMVTALLAI